MLSLVSARCKFSNGLDVARGYLGINIRAVIYLSIDRVTFLLSLWIHYIFQGCSNNTDIPAPTTEYTAYWILDTECPMQAIKMR
jgi:hypothetical protein